MPSSAQSMPQEMFLQEPSPPCVAMVIFQVAHRFVDDKRDYTLWPMEFTTYEGAEAWIKENYDYNPHTEWVIVSKEILH